MVQHGLTGKQLIERLPHLFDDEIFQLVIEGLQPYDKHWKLILPPGSESLLHEIATLMKKQCVIEGAFPKIQYAVDNYNEWHDLYINRKKNSQGEFENTRFQDGTTAKIRIRYNNLIAKIEKLQNKCSWKNYKLPKNDAEKDDVNELLLNARYKMEDIMELEKEFAANELKNGQLHKDQTTLETQQIASAENDNPLDVKTEDAEAFIRSIQVSYSCDTSIFITPQGDKRQEFTCKKMNFKDNSKTWRVLMDILQDKNHTYSIGPYDKGKDPVKKKEYNRMLKNVENCSKKFVAFLNYAYSAQIPTDFNIFENMKGRERAGTYKPKFQVGDKQYAIHSAEIKKLSKHETIKKIEILSEQIKKEKNEDQKELLLEKIGNYVEHARDKKYLSNRELMDFIQSPDEFVSTEDAMSHTIEIKDIKKF